MDPWTTTARWGSRGALTAVLVLGSFVLLIVGVMVLKAMPYESHVGPVERAFTTDLGQKVGAFYSGNGSAIVVIERAERIPPEMHIAPPGGMHEIPIASDRPWAGKRHVRSFVGDPDGTPCIADLDAIEDPFEYERTMDMPDVSDGIRQGRTFGYSISIDCDVRR